MIHYTRQTAEGAKIVRRMLSRAGIHFACERSVRTQYHRVPGMEAGLGVVPMKTSHLILVRSEDMPLVAAAEQLQNVRGVEWRRLDLGEHHDGYCYRSRAGAIHVKLGRKRFVLLPPEKAGP